MEKKKVAVLFSGGKDSCLAVHKILGNKNYEIKYLLSIIPENEESFMFHRPNLNLLSKQAERLGLKLKTRLTKGKKEEELEDLKELVRSVKSQIQGVVVGGIASRYQEKRIRLICEQFGLELIAPLWDFTSESLWADLFKEGFKVIITKVSCDGLDKAVLGKVIDRDMLKVLEQKSRKYGFRLDFEGGEAETAVLFMPEFKKDIKIEFDIIELDKYVSLLNIKKAD